MTAKEKLTRFLRDRSTPIGSKYLADYFLISKSAINRALSELEKEGKARRQLKGSKTYWTWIHKEPTPVAIPKEVVKLSNTPAYNRPIQNSYPRARGYDD